MTKHLDWRPPHPYVPGKSKRHPQHLFEFLKADVDNLKVEELPDTCAWQYAEIFYQEGYFWEAHELLETVWLTCPPNSAEKIYVQGKIQSANAKLKQCMGQHKAAAKLLKDVEALFAEARQRSNGVLFNGRIEI